MTKKLAQSSKNIAIQKPDLARNATNELGLDFLDVKREIADELKNLSKRYNISKGSRSNLNNLRSKSGSPIMNKEGLISGTGF